MARGVVTIAAHARLNPGIWLEHAVGRAMPVCAAALILLSCTAGTLAIPVWGRKIKHAIPILAETTEAESWWSLFQGVIAMVGSITIIAATFTAASKPAFEFVTDCAIYFTFAFLIIFIVAALAREFTKWPFLGLCVRVTTVLLLITTIAAYVSIGSDFVPSTWSAISPVENIGTPALSCAIGIFAFWICNLVVTPLAGAAFLNFNGRTNTLQRLIFESLALYQMIAITLQDGKVYIGWARSGFAQIESADGYFLFLPIFSGFRDKDTKELNITTRYNDVFEDLRSKNFSETDFKEALCLFEKVIPVKEIRYAGRFDEDYYRKFPKGVIKKAKNNNVATTRSQRGSNRKE